MRTIKVIFTTQKQDTPSGKAYSFNTSFDVQVGDLIQTPEYSGKYLQVVRVETEFFTHFSYKTGELCKKGGRGIGEIKQLSNEAVIAEVEYQN